MRTAGTANETAFGAALRAMTDDELDHLLAHRPDLATPPPTSFLALAASATGRPSLDRALSRIDALHLAVCEAVVALDPVRERLAPDDVVAALGLDDPADAAPPRAVRTAIDDLLATRLLWDAAPAGRVRLRPSPGLTDLFGPYPAGLGPVHPDPSPVTGAIPPDAPRGAAQIVAALAWGPPVGVVPSSAPGRTAVRWLADRGLVLETDDRHIALPRHVGLSLRDGRTHRDVRARPPRSPGTVLGTAVVDSEAALAGLEAVRLVAALLDLWSEEAPGPLRGGGLAVLDLRRLATHLGVDETTAVLVVEAAATAGLLATDDEAMPRFAPTQAARPWLGGDTAHRWALLAATWTDSTRTPWLVGSRDERGALRAALSPDLARGWVPRLRTRLLDVLADDEPGRCPTRDEILDVLRWRTPRSTPPEQAVDGLLDDARFLGVTGAGGLSSAGRELTDPTGVDAAVLADAFAAMLPPEIDDVLLQGDLTGVVPGRPSAELAGLVERTALVESRGVALTLRFTPESVARALESMTADDLLSALARHSRVGVPQPLEYLVRDVARRRGSLRIGAASAYLRSDDAALLAGLAARADLRPLGFVVLAPTVLAASVPAVRVHEALQAAGVTAQIEGPGGLVVRAPRSAARARGSSGGRADRPDRVRPRGDGDESPVDAEARRRRAIAHLREADGPSDGTGRGSGGGVASPGRGDPGGTAPEPGDALDVAPTSPLVAALRAAIDDHASVWIEMGGPDGRAIRRRLRPLTLDDTRLRAVDPDRDAEVTVAIHHVVSVETTA